MHSPVSRELSYRARWSSWPREVAEYLQNWILEHRAPAFLIARAGLVVSKGGELARYGLADVREGDPVTGHAYFLEGLLPLDGARSVLTRVETSGGTFADIHLFPVRDGDCVVLLDGSREVIELAETEQALRQAEEHLRQAEKMEALGRLAGGVAHDFNNLLTVILGYAHVLAEKITQEPLQGAARQIIQSANRAAAMTRQLLSFSRRQPRHVETLDLNAVISQLQDPLRRLIGEDIDFIVDLEPALACVEADRGQIEQVLINLAVNARDAMPKGGNLRICTANARIDASSAEGHSLPYGDYARVSVSDDGCGMDAETRARAFEPFFTSKGPGRGTGLGLSIVYGIVIQSGGEILLESEPGHGTHFDIFLPAVNRAPSQASGCLSESPTRGAETILVVEDEDAVRQLLCSILTGLGYSVLESADATAALELSKRHSSVIDLLVTDLVMPQMNGLDLAGRIVTEHPETKVLFVSGYAGESFGNRGITVTGSHLLSKPFTPGLLARRVREALDRPPKLDP
jgi:signal transduction histidine kinase